jgi:hypothetical protein
VGPYIIAESMRPGARLDRFHLTPARIERLADALADVLDERGWYTDFELDGDKVVIFPHRIVRYRRGDRAARAEAEAYRRSLGIPTRSSTGSRRRATGTPTKSLGHRLESSGNAASSVSSDSCRRRPGSGVRYGLAGGLATALHGSPSVTNDLDLASEQSRANLERLAAALTEPKALRHPAPGAGEPS